MRRGEGGLFEFGAAAGVEGQAGAVELIVQSAGGGSSAVASSKPWAVALVPGKPAVLELECRSGLALYDGGLVPSSVD